jgi:hypothetical protein
MTPASMARAADAARYRDSRRNNDIAGFSSVISSRADRGRFGKADPGGFAG